MDYFNTIANRIPTKTRKTILAERFIERAVNVAVENSPMQYLFDVYEHFIDNGEHDDWQCHKCRDFVLSQWKKLKPYLEELEKEKV